jgi:hypothetical protein
MIQLKYKYIKVITTIIKIVEYDVKMFRLFSVVRIIVGSHVVERLSRWILWNVISRPTLKLSPMNNIVTCRMVHVTKITGSSSDDCIY